MAQGAVFCCQESLGGRVLSMVLPVLHRQAFTAPHFSHGCHHIFKPVCGSLSLHFQAKMLVDGEPAIDFGWDMLLDAHLSRGRDFSDQDSMTLFKVIEVLLVSSVGLARLKELQGVTEEIHLLFATLVTEKVEQVLHAFLRLQLVAIYLETSFPSPRGQIPDQARC